MQDHLAVFCAQFLIFVQAALAFGMIAKLLPQRRHLIRRRWLVSMVCLCALSGLLAAVGGLVYHDPRPFVSDGVTSLIKHKANNGFPSDHALAAAVTVAGVGLLSPIAAVPLAALAVAVDWGRVACRAHHPIDVIGSTGIVLLALVLSVLVARQVRSVPEA
jgi:undecaprenyl-diphosphatase